MIRVNYTLRKNLISKLLTIEHVVVEDIGSQLLNITSKDFKSKSLSDKDSMRLLHVRSSRRDIEKTLAPRSLRQS